MRLTHHYAKRFVLAITVICIASAASCNLPDTRTIDFEFTGQVLDFDTKEPIDGAYVLAIYEKVDLGMAGSARYCVKTKGMTTGKDGKFNFPLDRLDGNSPSQVFAIKADYYYWTFEQVPSDVWKKHNRQTYSNRHAYLKKQNPAKPDFLSTFSSCSRAESREAVEAGIRYLELMLIEKRKYSKNRTNDSTEYFIKQLQSAPDKN